MTGGSAVLEDCDDLKRSEHAVVKKGVVTITLLDQVVRERVIGA